MSFFQGIKNLVHLTRAMGSADFGSAARGSTYQGAGRGRTLRNWRAPSTGPNEPLLFDADNLRDRSRDMSRNDPWGAAMAERRVTNMVGTGIKPRSEAPEEEHRAAIQDLWKRWTDEADADGILDFYGLQELATREWNDAGECFGRFRFRRPEDGLTVPLQLQLIESEQVPHNYNTVSPANNPIRAGIERDMLGRRVGYWMYREHPGERFNMRANSGEIIRVPGDEVFHMFQPMRAGQLRGYPTITPVLAKMYQMGQFDDATIMRQWVATLFAGFMKRPTAKAGAINPLTGKPRDEEQDWDETDIASLESGTIQELPPGWEMEWADPPEAGSTYEGFMRYQLMSSAAAVGMSYEVLTGDLRGINDRLLRALLQEFRRRVRMWQHHLLVHQFCRVVWSRWMDTAVLAGALQLPDYENRRAEYQSVRWVPERWPYLHPVQDVQAEVDEIRAGLSTRSERVNERGEDIESLDQEYKADQDRADRLGIMYSTDVRLTSSAGVAQDQNRDVDDNNGNGRPND